MGKVKTLWENYLGIWKKLTGWRLFAFYLLHYTVLFLALQPWVFSDFYEAEKSFIWQTDGAAQYFPRLVYISKTVREGIQALLHGEGWTIPLYDFRLGAVKPQLGFEPIQLLAVLWPWDRIDELYDILVLLRFYLVGAAFSVMGFYFKQRPMPILIGGIAYAFCGYSLYFCLLHPAFLCPMIFLPLLIVGAEQVLKEERGWFFSCCVLLVVLEDIYFAYILGILVVLYFFVRYFCAYATDGVRGFYKMIGGMALWGGLGILLGGTVLAPSILQMTGTGRVGRDVGNLLKYEGVYYQGFLMNFTVIADGVLIEGSLGLSVVAVPCAASLFLKKRGKKTLRVLFLLLTGMLMVPVAGYVLSGFNNIINRWSFAYALCICVIIMVQAPKFLDFDKKELALTLGISLIYITICRFLIERKYFLEEPQAMLLLLLAFMALCYRAGKDGLRFLLPVCLAFTCLSAYYGAYLRYDSAAGNATRVYINKDFGYETLGLGQYASVSQVDKVRADDTFFRVAGSNILVYEKMGSFYYGLNGTSFYSSAFFPGYIDMQNALEVKRTGASNANYGNDARAALLALNSVKYYAARENSKAAIPYGFEEIGRVKNGANTDVVLENQYALPIGYTYDSYLSEENFSQLSVLDQQSALLQGVLTTAEDIGYLPEAVAETSAQKIPVRETEEDGLSWKDGALTITKEKASISLTFQGLPNTDTYLRIVGLDPTPGSDDTSWNSSVWDVTVETDNTRTAARFIADNYVYAHGVKSQLVYLGSSETGLTSCTITFPRKAAILLNDLEIWCQPMDNYAEQIESLRAEALENVEINWRGLTGTISTTKDKFLCFSIPYDEGWSAYVDGKKANLVQANIGFMGVELPAGDHVVELKYWLPGLTAGIVMSFAGLIGIVGLVIWRRKRKGKKRW